MRCSCSRAPTSASPSPRRRGSSCPVVRGAERLTIAQIAQVRADLVGRARDAKLRAEDLEGGTFTISNLGMYDVDQFIAVLNPPQASILAVGATREQVVPRDGELRRPADDDDDAHVRPSRRRRRDRRGRSCRRSRRSSRTRASRSRRWTPTVWYYVRDLDAARRFYRETLGFEEIGVDLTERWSHARARRDGDRARRGRAAARTAASRTSTSPT